MKTKNKKLSLALNNQPIAHKISLLFISLFGLVFVINTTCMFFIKRNETTHLVEQSTIRNSIQTCEFLSSMVISLVEEMLLLNEYIVDYETPQKETESENAIALNKYVNGINLRNNNFQYIHSILINNGENQRWLYQANNWEINNNNSPIQYINPIKKESTETHWTGIIPSSTYGSSNSIPVVSFITPFFPSGWRNNVVILNLSVPGLSKYLNKQLSPTDTALILNCGNGDYITSGKEADYILEDDEFQEFMMDLNDESGIFHYKNYVVSFQQMKPTAWYVVTVTDLSLNSGSIYSYLIAITITFFCLFIVLSFGAYSVVKMITNPLCKLSDIMGKIGTDGNLDTRFQAKYSDEIGNLARGYNEMMDRIVALTLQVVQNEEQKRTTEIQLMQMQIKPHFLYNALETSRYMVEMGDSNASEMIAFIAKFYKLTLNCVSEQTSVKEELEHLDCYLHIQSVRYASVFSYEMCIDPSVYPFQTMRFLLQPLVENAIYHGLKCRIGEKKGILRITATLDNCDVVFEVYDNGVGIASEKLSELRKQMLQKDNLSSEHIGVYNVNRRLVLSYGKNYCIEIDSVHNKFSRFTVRIPNRLI